ncbi:MAG: Alpha-acetolactate decarboxylase [Deltaproteobacteria bacterium]|nr:Alpha-acetolactate decarboxylase [Deltaproteobacteria bacterium]
MMLPKIKLLIIACLVLLPGAVCVASDEVITQVSTIDALMAGIYDGVSTLAELRKNGDFGLGTLQALDGELILLDGVFYQVTADGVAVKPDPSVKTPFAAVTFFTADRNLRLKEGSNFQEFTESTEKWFPSRNIFYAVKLKGSFKSVKTRSVPSQKKPYRPLAEIVKTQPVFEFKNIAGTVVGLWCPPFVKGINVPGYHLHFITSDGKAGGHVLDFVAADATAEFDDTRELFLVLPDDNDFNNVDLKRDRSSEVKAVEK